MDDQSFWATGPAEIGFLAFGGLNVGGVMLGKQGGLWCEVFDSGPNSPFTDQIGVSGTARDGPGIVGTSSTSHGVYGQLGDPGEPAGPAGVCGSSQKGSAVCGSSRDGFGVIGSSSQLAGVLGQADKSGGVLGGSRESVGVGGVSDRFHGILGVSFGPPGPGTNRADFPAGVYGQSMNGSFGVLGVADSAGTAVAGIATRDAPYAGYFEGNLFVTGQIFAGTKDAMVPFPDGSQRLLHCMESPEHWFEDFGSARLTRGRATVKLDADFAKVVKKDYHVFVTPAGDCRGLCAHNKTATSFEVSELQGGTSNVAFSYRVVARRKDIKAHTRFAKIDTPLPKPIGNARAARAPSSIRTLLATLKKHTRAKPLRWRARAARGPSSIRRLLAALKSTHKVRRKPAR
jgi:hypothetical protein